MTRERTQIGFREMNALIDEVADVYQEIKSDVQSGNDIDQDELDELLAKVQRLIRLKFETLDEFPPVAGLPFKQLYQELKFIDDAVEFALRLVLEFITLRLAGLDVDPPSTEFIRKLVEIAKAEKKFLEGELERDRSRDQALGTLNLVLDMILEELNEDPIDWRKLERLLKMARDLKKTSMVFLPDVFGTKFAWWYEGLRLLDVLLVSFRSELLDRENQVPRIREAELKMMDIKLEGIKKFKEILENYAASAEEAEEGG